MTNEIYWLWFENIKGFGKVKKKVLLAHFSNPKCIFHACNGELKDIMIKYDLFRQQDMKNFFESKDLEKVNRYYRMVISNDINIISIDSMDYPNRLKNILDPPNILYYRGELVNETAINIAIVGARTCSNYGKIVAQKLATSLSNHGINVISGLARGIDTYAHKGALEGEGKTVAVLGSGVNVCYPKENERLFEKIVEKGCIMSEIPINGAPIPANFPMRNRIISGISDGVLIVEAAKKSGSLITADCALEQGKDVFVIPGRITDKCSEGTNELIKMGAKPITHVNDILEEYNIETMNMNNTNKTNELNEIEKLIYASINIDPTSVDKISKATGIPVKDLHLVLLKLELRGIVCRLANNLIVRI